jgi:hypothetical protein
MSTGLIKIWTRVCAKIASFARKCMGALLKPFLRKSAHASLATHQRRRLSELQRTLVASEANNFISQLLSCPEPCMIARFGSVELTSLIQIERQQKQSHLEAFYDWTQTGSWPFSRKAYIGLWRNADFFPISRESTIQFYNEMIRAMRQVDLLASWVEGEDTFLNELSRAQVCDLPSIEPYYHSQPWSYLLKAKTVLVIHPFASSIESQYKHNRGFLFADSRVLPSFKLKTLKSVQSIAGNHVGFPTWIEALDWMTRKALEEDFDVAIIGCGAYGFPLAARLKRAGKKAIHLGGATQILFGIKGKRWDEHPIIKDFFNDHWVRPSEHECPKNASVVEDACYW